jgi:hypothetical protein
MATGAAGDKSFRLTADGKVYRKGRKVYANRDVYNGEFLDGMRHGEGNYGFHNGDRYVGEFERDRFHGEGVYSWAPFVNDMTGERFVGKRYDGQWKDGKKHGTGLFLLGNGTVYTGEFESDMYNGHGTLRTAGGDVYTGEWVRNKGSGQMSVVLGNDDLYEGKMYGGKFHGQGRYTFTKDSSFYEGAWERGLKHGKGGVRLFSNHNKYIGNYFQGEPHGQGVMIYVNGDQYVGEWNMGLPNGQGVMKYAHGEQYEGTFLQSKFYGHGKYTYSDGGYYEGEYKNTAINKMSGLEFPKADGKRHGLGARIWSNGARYEGEWENDQMVGAGVLTDVEGCTYVGNFLLGARHGKGTQNYGNVHGVRYVCPMGHRHRGMGYCKYAGDWVQGYYEGEGIFECIDGRRYTGTFKKHKRHGFGKQEYIRYGEQGDEKRQFMGNNGAMYRFCEYEGEWVEGHKEGRGIIHYQNGSKMECYFQHGQPHGPVIYTFPSGKVDRRTYVRGEWQDRDRTDKAAVAFEAALSESLAKARKEAAQDASPKKQPKSPPKVKAKRT